jgi:hypothetical protein
LGIYEVCYSILSMVQQNSYPLKDWHFEHMQKTIVKYVTGLSEYESNSSWKRRQHKKYSGNLGYVRRNINFDIKHGVTRQEVIAFLDKVRNDSSFSNLRESTSSMERIEELEIEK